MLLHLHAPLRVMSSYNRRIKMNLIVFLSILTYYIAPANCHCPRSTKKGYCNYYFECTQDINNFELEPKCLPSRNYNTSVTVIINDAMDPIGHQVNEHVMQYVTTLSITSASWPETSLAFLQNMYYLKTLNIVRSGIHYISGRPFKSLQLLENICLSHNMLSDIDKTFHFEFESNRMKTLSLSHNRIENLTKNTFASLTKLIELDLSHNYISSLTEEPFDNLTSLVTLRLEDNRIKDLNGAMNKLVSLKYLYLMYNKLNYMDEDSIATINHLIEFDVSNNGLEKLQPAVLFRHWYHFQHHTFLRINLSGNHIYLIPNTTDDTTTRKIRDAYKNELPLDVSTYINLSNNSISKIEYNAFEIIVNLVSLDASNNKLSTFSVNPEHVQHMMYLNLSGNLLKTLYYECILSMRNLQNLDLSNNEIYLPPHQSLSSSQNLMSVNLTYNHIAKVEHLRLTFNGKPGILDLSFNNLSVLIFFKDEAAGLTELILSHNFINDTRQIHLKDQNHLQRLHMNNNYIQDLDKNSLLLPGNLVFLDISLNSIKSIGSSTFHRLINLETLYLSHNNIDSIQYGMFNGLKSLTTLDLSYNKIGVLDSKCMLDLNSLRFLSVRQNNIMYIDYSGWLLHESEIIVSIDGNKYSCDWLAKALNDYNHGYSKMRLESRGNVDDKSVLGIPCEQDAQYISSQGMLDDRLLITSEKILKAVLEQTSFLKNVLSTNNIRL